MSAKLSGVLFYMILMPVLPESRNVQASIALLGEASARLANAMAVHGIIRTKRKTCDRVAE